MRSISLRILIVIFICVCMPDLLFSQAYTSEDSIRIYKLLDQADEADMAGNLDRSMQFAKDALSLSKERKMLRGEGFALLKIADLRLKKEGGKGISLLFSEPERIAKQINDNFLLGLTYHQMGQYYRDQSQYPEAKEHFLKAVVCYKAANETEYEAIAYNDIGYIQDRSGEYEKAVEMYLNAVRLFEKLGNKKEEANTLGNIAISYYKFGKKEEAIQLFKKSAAIRESIGDMKGLTATYGNLVTTYTSLSQFDSAYKYQKMAVAYAEKTGVKNTMAQVYANASALLLKQNKASEALPYEQKAIQLYTEMGDKVKIGNRYVSLASIYDHLKDSVNAELYFNKAINVAQEIKNKPLFQSAYSARSAFYNQRGNYLSALDNYKLSVVYKDSLLNEKTATNIAELQTKYETEKKDNEIARLDNDRIIKQLELEKQKAIIAGDKLEAQKKENQIQLLKQQQQLRDAELVYQKNELERQLLLNKNNEQQLLLSVQQLQISENEKKLRMRQLDRERLLRNSIIAGTIFLLIMGLLLFNRFQLRKKLQEQERLLAVRNKISKDLHDEIGSTLTSIHILSNVSATAMDSDLPQAKQMLDKISQQSKTIQQNMSDIVWAIRPDNDKLENLAARMREYLGQTLEPKQIQTRVHVNEAALQQFLPMEHRKELLLLFKEAINNIVKHAGASAVDFQLDMKDGVLQMRISDNGTWKGNSSGTGTYSMQQRATGLGGKVEITGNNSGTTVQLELPVP